jgi:hypothetical protein
MNKINPEDGSIKHVEAYLGTTMAQYKGRDAVIGDRVIKAFPDRGGDCIGELSEIDKEGNLMQIHFDIPPDGGSGFKVWMNTSEIKDAK